jgi:hypothetical protein
MSGKQSAWQKKVLSGTLMMLLAMGPTLTRADQFGVQLVAE